MAAQFLEAGMQKLEVAMKVPDFRLKVLGGEKMSLRELQGKIVLLNFFAYWCEICRKESAAFDKLGGEMKGKGVVFLKVATEGKEKDLLKFMEKYNISSPILLDKNGSVARAYQVFGHHETFFLSREGKIVGKSFGIGIWTSPNMKSFLEHLVAGTNRQISGKMRSYPF
jgi:peroxiredoxin